MVTYSCHSVHSIIESFLAKAEGPKMSCRGRTGEERAVSGAGISPVLPSERPAGYQAGDVFIKSFVFYPEVPIRIDYEAKRFHSGQVVC